MKAPVCPFPLVDAEPGRNHFDDQALIGIAANRVGLEPVFGSSIHTIDTVTLDGKGISFLVHGMRLKLEEFSHQKRDEKGELEGKLEVNRLPLAVQFIVESSGVAVVPKVSGIEREDRSEEFDFSIFRLLVRCAAITAPGSKISRSGKGKILADMIRCGGKVLITWEELGFTELVPTQAVIASFFRVSSQEGLSRSSLANTLNSPFSPDPESIPKGFVTPLGKALLIDRWEAQLRMHEKTTLAVL